MGEMWKGCAQGCNDAVFMAVGTGIGIGIVANGNIISGTAGAGGAIGWLALSRPYLRDRFGLSELSTGSLLSTLPFGLLLGSIAFGSIVDRYGYKILLITCGLLIFAGLEGIALTSDINILLTSAFPVWSLA